MGDNNHILSTEAFTNSSTGWEALSRSSTMDGRPGQGANQTQIG